MATSYDASKTPAVASLVAMTSASADEALAFYSKSFLAQGFTAVPAESPKSKASGAADTRVLDFVRADGKETATVSTVTANGKTTVTVGAAVAASSLK
ncbi:hypothetical protein ABCQ75_15435 [Sinomonas halotolerans]|uniref:Uncharacterized protein n=2 Tax=Sinomonas halotolerans TaxID=1644133 RepID=A0ABU9X389_9MICC